jgi:hypothetical protein
VLVGQISLIGDIVLVEFFLDVHLVELHNSFLKLLVVREIVFDSVINIILELLFLIDLCLDLVLDLLLFHLQTLELVFQILDN